MQSLPLGAWCTSIDLKDAFLHVPIARKHRKYLCFRIGGAAFQFRALPFGLTTSPLVFTRIVKTVGAYAHSQGLNMLLYLDDWNISAPSPTLCARWMEWVLRLTASLGLIPNLPKCDLTPSQQFVFIGIAFDLNTGMACPAPHRVANFLRLLRDFLLSRAPPAVKWQRLLGHMTSLEKLTRRGGSPHASCSVHTPRPMVTVIRPPSSSCAHYARASSGPTVVVSFSQPHLRSAPPPAPAGPTHVHRRLQRGLGGSPPLAPDRGPLGLGPETSAHQCSGASGRPPGPAALPAPCPGPAGNGYDRQHYSHRSAAQSGGDAIKAPLQPHCPTAALGRQSHQLSAPSHSGQAERYSRLLVTPSSGPQLRVDPVTSGSPSGVASVGPTPCGHVRHSQQRTPAHVRLSTSGPPGMADRRLILHLDRPLDLPVSSVPTSTRSSMAHKSNSLPGDSDCPSVAVPALVSPAAETPCRPATPTPTDQNPYASTVVTGVPPGAPASVSSRVASIRSGL